MPTNDEKSINRGEQLLALRKLFIPTVLLNDSRISGATLKIVLRTIDDHGDECWASVQTIASETCLTDRSVQRAIRALRQLSLIEVTERSGQSSLIRIFWSDIINPRSEFTPEGASPPKVIPLPPKESHHTPEGKSPTPEGKSPKTRRNGNETKRKRESRSTDVDDTDLREWVSFWNSLKEADIVHAGVSTRNEGVRSALKRICKSPELRELLSDRELIRRKIQSQPFLKAGWFTLPRLLAGKNKTGEYIVQRILDGGYLDSTPRVKTREANVGAGVVHNPERKLTDARF